MGLFRIMQEYFGPTIFGEVFSKLSGNPLEQWPLYVMLAAAIILAISVHEFGHAWMADRLGDPQPREEGRVSLSPFKHFDTMGFLMVFATALIGYPIGWGKTVKTDPDLYKVDRRTGILLVAAAGPVANLLAAAVLAIPARLLINAILDGYIGEAGLIFFVFIAIVMLINISQFCFNLIPVAPMDGSYVVASLLPPTLGVAYQKFMKRYGSYLFVTLMFSGVLDNFIGPMIISIFRILLGV